MPSPYKPYIPQTIGDLRDMLGMMMLYSPTFKDHSGYFPERNVNTVFSELNQSLQALRGKLGVERYLTLRSMSDQMRAHFEADPEDRTGEALKGRDLIDAMDKLLGQSSRTL